MSAADEDAVIPGPVAPNVGKVTTATGGQRHDCDVRARVDAQDKCHLEHVKTPSSRPPNQPPPPDSSGKVTTAVKRVPSLLNVTRTELG